MEPDVRPDVLPRFGGQSTLFYFFLLLVSLGTAEAFVGQTANSISLIGDGIGSFGDAAIVGTMWVGLEISRRPPDRTFNFGYRRVESLALMFAAFAMVVIASTLLYESYLRVFNPDPISHVAVSIAVLLVAGISSLVGTAELRRIARSHKLVSLKIGVYNAAKDSTSSFVVLAVVVMMSLGATYMDAVGGFAIAGYIYSIAYVSFKEASLVLADAIDRPEVEVAIRKVVEKYGFAPERIMLRSLGSSIVGSMVVEAPGNLTLDDVALVRRQMAGEITRIDSVQEMMIEFVPIPVNEGGERRGGAPSSQPPVQAHQ